MNQYFSVNDAKGYTLDLAVSTLCLEPVQAVDFLQHPSAHHEPVFFWIPVDVPATLHFSSVEYNFFKGDYDSINNELSVIQWDNVLSVMC